MARFDLRRPRVWLPLFVVLLLIAVVAVRVWQATAPADPMPTVDQLREERGIAVAVAAAAGGRLEIWRRHSGTVAGVREGVLRSRSDDPVAVVTVAVGETVREGQVLVRMAGEGLEARDRQTRAALAQARRLMERMRPLHEAGAISDQEWDQVVSQHEMAEADAAAIRASLELTSPLAGMITEVLARPGLVTRSGDPLVRVADLSQRMVYLHVSAADAAELRAGQPARAANGTTGRVHRVALQADPATRLVEVVVAFPPASALIAGTMATIEVRVAERDDAVHIPRGAVRDGSVWVVGGDDRVTRRAVRIGLQGEEVIEVLEGVAPGDRVVVEGAALLSEGAAVRIAAGREG